MKLCYQCWYEITLFNMKVRTHILRIDAVIQLEIKLALIFLNSTCIKYMRCFFKTYLILQRRFKSLNAQDYHNDYTYNKFICNIRIEHTH